MSIFLRKPYLLALIITAALLIWLASGQTKIVTQAKTTVTTLPMQVQIMEQVAESLTK